MREWIRGLKSLREEVKFNRKVLFVEPEPFREPGSKSKKETMLFGLSVKLETEHGISSGSEISNERYENQDGLSSALKAALPESLRASVKLNRSYYEQTLSIEISFLFTSGPKSVPTEEALRERVRSSLGGFDGDIGLLAEHIYREYLYVISAKKVALVRAQKARDIAIEMAHAARVAAEESGKFKERFAALQKERWEARRKALEAACAALPVGVRVEHVSDKDPRIVEAVMRHAVRILEASALEEDAFFIPPEETQ